MKINPFSATPAAEAAGQSGRVSSKGAEATAKETGAASYSEDRTSLTSANDTVRSLTAAAAATDPARAARVQSLKQAVAQGQYSIEPDKIASALASAKI